MRCRLSSKKTRNRELKPDSVFFIGNRKPDVSDTSGLFNFKIVWTNYLQLSSIATAQATVIPTMGLLPAPMSPIIST